MHPRPGHQAAGWAASIFRSRWTPLLVAAYAAAVYWVIAQRSTTFRPDYFFLADAFLHGRTWVDATGWPPAFDLVILGDRLYFPFPPLPAMLLAIPSAIVGAGTLVPFERLINVVVAGLNVGLCWVLLSRFDAGRIADRIWLSVFFGFSTMHWWVTVVGGPWHMTQLLATTVTFGALLEATGRRRPWLLGLLAGAAFLARTPTVMALPLFVAVAALPPGAVDIRAIWPVALRRAALCLAAFTPAVIFTLAYNALRFGSPFESGYALATLPPWLAELRAMGLFSPVHLPRNLEYLLWHPPEWIGPPNFFKPDGLGLSLFLTSPALLVALKARWRDRFVAGVGVTAVLVLLPSLLYYGGGFYQLGFRYLLDSMPFLMVLMASSVGEQALSRRWKVLIVAGVLVVGWGLRWA
ncbi:MAG TPA: hypothetical protein VFK38_06675 [Candidatus Limnocylindrales bacterium]|nr:hypothetical protein [Candidatus Limnocylindrales bacterium]